MTEQEKVNLPIPQSRLTAGLGGITPLAWELLVRDQRTDWKRYNLYETEKAATNAMERTKGEPLQLKVRPLYALEWVSVRDRRPRIDDETIYLGMNDQGFTGCFNHMRGAKCPSTGEVYWHCDYLTAEEDIAVLSGLAYWMPLPVTPNV